MSGVEMFALFESPLFRNANPPGISRKNQCEFNEQKNASPYKNYYWTATA